MIFILNPIGVFLLLVATCFLLAPIVHNVVERRK